MDRQIHGHILSIGDTNSLAFPAQRWLELTAQKRLSTLQLGELEMCLIRSFPATVLLGFAFLKATLSHGLILQVEDGLYGELWQELGAWFRELELPSHILTISFACFFPWFFCFSPKQNPQAICCSKHFNACGRRSDICCSKHFNACGRRSEIC